MKLSKQIGLFALGVLSILPSALAVPSALAQTASPDIFRDSLGNVYIQGSAATTLTANPRIATNETLSRSIRAGYCGELVLSTSSTNPSIGNSWNVNSTTVTRPATTITNREMLPTCRNAAFLPATSGAFVDATTPGRDRVVLTGYAPGQSYRVMFDDVTTTRSVRPNNCGFFRLSNTTANPLPEELSINGTNQVVSALPVANPPLCQRGTNGQYIRYIPAP